ncbi:MAG: hypothetical protein AAFR20_00855 [Pseudomonadota bacterium]
MSLIEPKFLLGEAAIAAGLTPSTVRSWINKKQIALESDENRKEQSHRKVSVIETLRFALAGALTKQCLSVEQAWDIAIQHVNFDKDFRETYGWQEDDLEGAIDGHFQNKFLYISRHPELRGWKIQSFTPTQRGVIPVKIIEEYPAATIVNLTPLFQKTIRRLAEAEDPK